MISILVPTYNEEKYLPNLLDSIEKQTYKNYEIIVADANSKDKTRRIAKKYGCKVVKGGLTAVGRNNGAKAAKGDILLFLDADMQLPDEFFLARALHEFKRLDLGALACWYTPKENKYIYKLYWIVAHTIRLVLQFFKPYGAAAIMTTKKMHFRVGGFIEKPALMEEHIYARNISKIKKVRLLPWIRVRVSMRRFKSEGLFSIIKKYLMLEIYELLKKEPTYKDFDYKFGKF
ncbi:glycosyltransferase [Candidatus Woesearchaeota archaeon]|nr:glycosyltransferase [Candidatus Woesearchaeota archaeon]